MSYLLALFADRHRLSVAETTALPAVAEVLSRKGINADKAFRAGLQHQDVADELIRLAKAGAEVLE